MTPVSAFAARHVLAEHRSVAAPTFPPVTGYTAWYDSSQIAGQADNTALAAWPDGSTNHYDLAQPTGAYQPTYYKTTSAKLVNGKPAVWFNGNNSHMVTAGATPVAQSCFVVAQHGSLADSETPFSGDVAGTAQIRTISGKVNVLATSQAVLAAANTSVTLGACFVGYTYDGTTCSIYVNASTPDVTVGVAHTMISALILVGWDPSGAAVFNGPICEIVAYPTVLTGPQITSTYSYLKTKWGTP